MQDNQDITAVAPLPQKRNTLSFRDVFKKISKSSLNMAMSYTFSLEVFFLVFLLSHLNEEEEALAADTLITNMINSLATIGFSPLFAMSIVGAQLAGKLKKLQESESLLNEEKHADHLNLMTEIKKQISSIYRNGLFISAIVTPPIVATMVFAQPVLSSVFNQNTEVSQLAQNFLRPYSLAVPALMVRLSSEQIMFIWNQTKPAMIMALINLSIGMSLSVTLGFGYLGFPQLGNEGILIGYLTESYLTAISFTLYIGLHKEFKDFHFLSLFKSLKGNGAQMQTLLKLSKGFMFTVTTEMTMMLGTSFFAGMIGTTEQAAFAFTMQYMFLTFLMLAAFGQVSCQEMSRQLGAKEYEHASKIGRYGVLTTAAIIAPIPIILSIYPEFLMTVLGSNNTEIAAILEILVPIMSLGVIFDSIRFNLLQQLRALGDVNGSALVSTFCLANGLLSAGLLGLETDMGIYGVGIGYTSGVLLAAFALFLRWNSRIQPENIKNAIEHPPKPVSLTKCISSFFCREKNKPNHEQPLLPNVGLEEERFCPIL